MTEKSENNNWVFSMYSDLCKCISLFDNVMLKMGLLIYFLKSECPLFMQNTRTNRDWFFGLFFPK